MRKWLLFDFFSKQIGVVICYMNMQGQIMRNLFHRFAFVFLGILFVLVEILAQSPTHIDTRRKDPKPVTLDDILLYIVFPVLLFIAAYLGRRYQKKKKEKIRP